MIAAAVRVRLAKDALRRAMRRIVSRDVAERLDRYEGEVASPGGVAGKAEPHSNLTNREWRP